MSERAILLVLDAQAMNAQQARIAYNPDAERNSLLEDLLHLLPLTQGRAHEYVLSAIGHLRALIECNDSEREAERELAGLVDGVKPQGWSVKRAARVLRAPLGDLCNPMVGGTRRSAAAAIVDDFIATAPARLLSPSCVSLRHELGVSKFSALHELIADLPPVAA